MNDIIILIYNNYKGDNNMAIIPQIYNDAVVAIGALKEDGSKVWYATGFVVARKNEDGGYNTFLVSNKHVFDNGSRNILLRFNISGKIDAKDYTATLIDAQENKRFSVHPESDVACLLLNQSILSTDLGKLSAFDLEELALTREQMIENDVIEGSIIYSLGFPSGLVGVDSKVPLCRMGCISKIKEQYDANGYLLDIQNFPGSSGSPVINRIEANHLQGTKVYNSTKLIGILAKYIPYHDVLISRQTGIEMQIIQENSGIAVAYDVNSIKEVVEMEFARVKSLTVKVEANATDPTIKEPAQNN